MLIKVEDDYLQTNKCDKHNTELNSAWKSGPVWFFVKIQQDQDRDRSSQVDRPRKTGLNQRQPVQSGFSRFLTVARPV